MAVGIDDAIIIATTLASIAAGAGKAKAAKNQQADAQEAAARDAAADRRQRALGGGSGQAGMRPNTMPSPRSFY